MITPKNYNLFCVNLFVAATGLYQLGRIYRSVFDKSILVTLIFDTDVQSKILTFAWLTVIHVTDSN